MIVRWFWRGSNFRGKEWGASTIDDFWVEVAREEAVNEVFPKLLPAEIEESREFADQFLHVAEEIGKPTRPYCCLVARDLSTIDPFHIHYPFHQLWNASSPSEEMPTVMV